MNRLAIAWLSLALCAPLVPRIALAQQDAGPEAGSPDAGPPDAMCPAGAWDCVQAPVAFVRREGLSSTPMVDTGWVPASAPVQVRFVAAIAGHTEVRLGGSLAASWPRAMTVRMPEGPPGSGLLESDYGLQISARVRLTLDVGGRMFRWEGNVPYVPRVDFRATARSMIDPWAFTRVSARGMTARARVADVPLTDALISIPGISGGLAFDVRADLETGYRSLQLTFEGPPDALTAAVSQVTLPFAGGPLVELAPRVEGELDQRIGMTLYPALYVELLGRRFMLDIVDIPVTIPVGPRPWIFDRQRVRFDLPDIAPVPSIVDFGTVEVDTTAVRTVPIENTGGRALSVGASMDVRTAPFAWVSADRITLPPRSSRPIELQFSPTSVGDFSERIPLLTSDPDSPTVYLTARGRAVRTVPADGTQVDATQDAVTRDASPEAAPDASAPTWIATGNGGCACRTSPTHKSRSHEDLRGLGVLCAIVAITAQRRPRHTPKRAR
ncbi:MAG: hypothetical protein Q8Q09_07660 [Deltaproteobacteria bacterium]|nr:hypothetical protein [Deltaproteobacteria bacterium]